MEFEFLRQNWHLFAAVLVILALLALDPLRRRGGGIKLVTAVQLPQLVNHESAIILDVGEPAEF